MHNYGYEVDFPNEVDTRPSRRPVTQTSARRVPSGGYRSAQDAREAQAILDRLPRTPRQSRTTTAYYAANNSYVETDADSQIETSRLKPLKPQYKPRRPQSSRRQMHWSVYVGAGMCSILLLLFVTVHVYAWYINDIYQPGHYTQASHLDTAIMKMPTGHIIEGKAFVDPNNHLDLLTIPDGDMSKAKIIPGPLVTFDTPQAADLDVIAQGNKFVATATGPITTTTFSATPHTANLIAGEGGK